MITYLITGITVVVSFICFNNRLLFDKLSLKPYRIVHAKNGTVSFRMVLFMQTGCIYS